MPYTTSGKVAANVLTTRRASETRNLKAQNYGTACKLIARSVAGGAIHSDALPAKNTTSNAPLNAFNNNNNKMMSSQHATADPVQSGAGQIHLVKAAPADFLPHCPDSVREKAYEISTPSNAKVGRFGHHSKARLHGNAWVQLTTCQA
jgi:hypothetical protein